MRDKLVIKGRLTDDRHVELSEPVRDVNPQVEVTFEPMAPARLSILELLRERGPGTKTKEQIDAELREERASWDRKI